MGCEIIRRYSQSPLHNCNIKNFCFEKVLIFHHKIFKFYMSDSTQHSQMVKELQEIVELCKQSPSKLEVGIANLNSLYKAMKGFELASKAYVSLFNSSSINKIQDKNSINAIKAKNKIKNDLETSPAILKLGKIYGRTLKSTEMKDLAIIISQKTGLFLNRDQKRNKIQLLNWFSANWEIIEPAIIENELDKITFDQK